MSCLLSWVNIFSCLYRIRAPISTTGMLKRKNARCSGARAIDLIKTHPLHRIMDASIIWKKGEMTLFIDDYFLNAI